MKSFKTFLESRMQYCYDLSLPGVNAPVTQLLRWLDAEASEGCDYVVYFDGGPIISLEIKNINLANNYIFGEYVNMIETIQTRGTHAREGISEEDEEQCEDLTIEDLKTLEKGEAFEWDDVVKLAISSGVRVPDDHGHVRTVMDFVNKVIPDVYKFEARGLEPWDIEFNADEVLPSYATNKLRRVK